MLDKRLLKKTVRVCLLPMRLANYALNFAMLQLNNVSAKSFPKINGLIFIRNNGQIALGKGIQINSSLKANPIGGSVKTCLYTYVMDAKIVIGDRVCMSNAAIVAKKEIIIENDVYIGASVKIYDTDFHSLFHHYRILETDDPDVRSKPVLIKKNAFLGAHSIVLKGVTIGEGAVIGAGSVVTKSVGDFEIWAGNPARYVRTLKPPLQEELRDV